MIFISVLPTLRGLCGDKIVTEVRSFLVLYRFYDMLFASMWSLCIIETAMIADLQRITAGTA